MKEPAFWYPDPSAPGWLSWQPLALAPAGWLYGLGGALKSALATPYRAPVPVICIGNLTAGGTGKTPLSLWLAQALKAGGERPVFISRGYGGSETGPLLVEPAHTSAQVGDEPLLLAQTAPTIVAGNRKAAAQAAQAEDPTVLLMDDGFQNPSLVKDVSLLVVDGERGFGNRQMIPAGPLREPIARGLKRADLTVIMGGSELPTATPQALGLPPETVVARAHLKPVPALALFADGPLFAFAGIGRPEKFFATLGSLGLDVIGTRSFPDHHAYTPAEIADLRTTARQARARLITTQKDWVRLDRATRSTLLTLPVEAALEDPDAFLAAVSQQLASARAARA